MPHRKGHGRSSSNKKTTPAKKYEQKVESGRERNIRQSQTGSKYDKDVAKVAATQGLASFRPSAPGTKTDTGATMEYDRRQRIASGTPTNEDKRQIQNLANITGKNPYGAQTDGGITTLQKERELTPSADTPPEDKKDEKEQVTDYEYYLLPNGKLDIRKVKRNKLFFENLTGKKIANITADGTIIFQDQTQGMGQLKLVDLLGGALDKLTGFNPNKALTEGGMGDQGKAALFHKLSGMDPEQFREFLNRKGNLDRIREFSGDMSPKAMADFEAKLKAASSTGGAGGQFFADMIASTAGEDFEMLKLKNSPDKEDRRKYYQLNPPRTQGDLEEAAMAGVSYIPGYGPVERPDRGGNQQGGGGGISDVTPDPTPDPTPTNVPDFVLKRQYMPNFTPSYLGGPEQMQVAGGYYDPVTKKFIGNPYGTANQYQFAKGGIVGTSPLLFKNQGGMASDKGIKSFKKYGY